ncbi:signal peptidase I [Actinomadura rudentiformis]|uniref:Signal peptidase I n=1 Tax=Actinomadura rudentiformis TaxID=359158 RepID=A0A6H9YAM7_9ACTN|nr:signal peptidase I [Actinomadura rudentiformis]KAB2340858.1 signal peptidase I [Actinomadura rudentiformis]
MRTLLALTAASACVLLWARRRLLMITVRGLSMTPAYHPGDRVLVRRVPPTRIRTGDVVVVEQPPPHWSTRQSNPEWVIKRVAATPGDPVPAGLADTQPDGLADAQPDGLADAQPDGTVPDGCLVVLGDNPDESYDSRHYGYIQADRLIALVVRRMHRAQA